MGLYFLENNGCTINTGQRAMHLKGKAIPLNRESQYPPSNAVIKTCERLRIPPYSGIEIVAQAFLREEIDYDSVWLVEPTMEDTSTLVARPL